METSLLEKYILELNNDELVELLKSIDGAILNTELYVGMDDFLEIKNDLKWKERECESLENDISEYERDIRDLEYKNDKSNDRNNKFPTDNLKDELKSNFMKQIWDKYELEQLEEIFMWDPIKGLQK